MRRPIIAGNWKMFKTYDEAVYFILNVSVHLPSKADVETIIFAPAPLLNTVIKRQGENLIIGAQNIYPYDEGAYTGEVSPKLVKSLKAEYVLIGHSERRQIFKESNRLINMKVHGALKNELKVMLCIGETLKEREANLTETVLKRQLTCGLKRVSPLDMANIVVAYEPVWAIGTGLSASKELAQEAIFYIRRQVSLLYDEKIASQVRILYGGSVKKDNIADFLKMDDIDGALIGGASLDKDAFIDMAHMAKK